LADILGCGVEASQRIATVSTAKCDINLASAFSSLINGSLNRTSGKKRPAKDHFQESRMAQGFEATSPT
jgi:hypothetical protein